MQNGLTKLLSRREAAAYLGAKPQSTAILWLVGGLTVLSLGAVVYLAHYPELADQKGLLETFTTTWKMGFGAILGLIGAKP